MRTNATIAEGLCIFLTAVLIHAAGSLIPGAALANTPYLHYSTSCGQAANVNDLHKVLGWNGTKRRAFSTDVYDFSIECNGSRRPTIDLFLSSIDNKRYELRAGTLYKHTGDVNQYVRIPEAERGCRTVHDNDWCSRTPDELYKICRGDGLCEIEFSAYRCKKPRRQCDRP